MQLKKNQRLQESQRKQIHNWVPSRNHGGKRTAYTKNYKNLQNLSPTSFVPCPNEGNQPVKNIFSSRKTATGYQAMSRRRVL